MSGLPVLTLREKLRGFLLVHLDDALLADGRAGGATVPDFAVDFGYVVQAAPERDDAQPACVGQQGEELHDCTPRRRFSDLMKRSAAFQAACLTSDGDSSSWAGAMVFIIAAYIK
jgi:hypothetical protein